MTRLVAPLDNAERGAFVAAARSHIGTAFWHLGRGPRRLDCVGLVIVALAEAGRTGVSPRAYGRDPEQDRLREHLIAHFGTSLPLTQAQPGDIALMAWGPQPQHVAIVADYLHGGLSLIHADAQVGKVVEHGLAAPWPDRIVEVYRP